MGYSPRGCKDLNMTEHVCTTKPFREFSEIAMFHIKKSIVFLMAPHSSTLAWKIPWTEEPGRLQSMGSLGVGHD